MMYTLRIVSVTFLLMIFTANSQAKIVFSAIHNENSNIYVMDDDGSNIRQITNTPYYDKSPYWSPNGKRIAFIRIKTLPDQKGNTDIYTMYADGSNIQQLTYLDLGMIDLAFSPDGKRIVFTQNLSDQSVFDIDTGEVNQILRSHINQIDWSPDGKTMIFVNDSHQFISKDLWMMDANGDNPRKWTKPDPEKDPRNHYYPRWSSDGKKILYCEAKFNFEAVEVEDGVIFKMWAKGQFLYIIHNIQDDGTEILDIPDNWFCSSLSWMNDQQMVLFSAYEYKKERFTKPAYNIYKYDLSSNQFIHMTEGLGADWHEGRLEVTPVGKKSIRWSELKKAYSGR